MIFFILSGSSLDLDFHKIFTSGFFFLLKIKLGLFFYYYLFFFFSSMALNLKLVVALVIIRKGELLILNEVRFCN